MASKDVRPENLVLLPGLLCNEALWAESVAPFKSRISITTIGLDSASSIKAMAELVLAHAPERFALAGFSMGGQVALEVVASAPQRVVGLALLSTNDHGLPPRVRAHLEDAMHLIERQGLDAYLSEAFPRYFPEARRGDARLRQFFEQMATRLGPAVALRQMRALLAYEGNAGVLGTLRCPTAFICGELDERTPVALHIDMAGKVPGSSIRVIRDAGHFTLLEQPQDVAQALCDWLQKG